MGNNRICKKCGGISGWDSYFNAWICTRCGDMVRKSITNGDRIQAMTDEELAEWINKHDCYIHYYGYDKEEAVLEWLKQENEDEKIKEDE